MVRDSATQKRYLICSGRANTSACSARIGVRLDELELAVAGALEQLLAQCPGVEICPAAQEQAQQLQQIDIRIGRLVSALAESGAVPATYISAQIEALHRQRERLLGDTRPHPGGQALRVDFARASFEEKKLIARTFIRKILLQEDSADIFWRC